MQMTRDKRIGRHGERFISPLTQVAAAKMDTKKQTAINCKPATPFSRLAPSLILETNKYEANQSYDKASHVLSFSFKLAYLFGLSGSRCSILEYPN
jgi:hypothetical protein